MLFNSGAFLLFFPIVLLVYFVIPEKGKNLWLLAASYYFYMNWNPKYGLLLLFCTVVTYCGSLLIAACNNQESAEQSGNRRRKLILSGGLVIIFAILFYFKYFDFAVTSIESVMSAFGSTRELKHPDIVLPVGISFFTFQAASYLIDVYRGKTEAEKNFFKYALFVSFFPQLVAGPIERSSNLLHQLNRTYKFNYERFKEGLLIMLWGYFLKIVVADRAAIFVDSIYGTSDQQGGAILLLTALIFSFQSYGDFAGYSTIAIGAAKILGIELMENFNAPYLATSMGDLWTRWHISLNTWFRDYLYFPLGGSRKGKLRKNINLMIIFLVSGLWHGASWHFVVWGGINGAVRIIEDLTAKWRRKLCDILHLNTKTLGHRILQSVCSFVTISVICIFFRASTLSQAVSICKTILLNPRLSDLTVPGLYTHGLNRQNLVLLMLSIILLTVADVCKENKIVIRKVILQQNWWLRCVIFAAAVVLLLVLGIWGNAYDARNFIYFQF